MKVEVNFPKGFNYDKDEIIGAIECYNLCESFKFGELGHQKTEIINLNEVSHEIKDRSIEFGNYYCDIKILNTPNGKILTDYYKDKIPVNYEFATWGLVDKDKNVTSLNIYSINVLI